MRTDDDSWDVNTSVGATALFVACGRAIETRRSQPLIVDTFAEHFINAAHNPLVNVDNIQHWDAPLAVFAQAMPTSIALRTFAIDEAITSHRTEQIVILASGLDARSHRLDYPDGTVIFEIDLPSMLSFKDEVYRSLQATARAQLHYLPVDLRKNWLSVLEEAGFCKNTPTTWVTEGLLPYLSSHDQFSIRDAIVNNSVPGSQWLLTAFPTMNSFREKINSPTYISDIIEGFGQLFYDQDNIPGHEELLKSLEYSFEDNSSLIQRTGYTSPDIVLTPEQSEKITDLSTKNPELYTFIADDGHIDALGASLMDPKEHGIVTVRW